MITRKNVLLECLEHLRKQRDAIRDSMVLRMTFREREEKETLLCEAEQKVDILQDVIHYLDTDHGKNGLREWQKQEMKDPEKCRREAMDFAVVEGGK